MKKLILIALAVFLNMGLFSCTPQAVSTDLKSKQACCGDDENFPPPPPPPYGGG